MANFRPLIKGYLPLVKLAEIVVNRSSWLSHYSDTSVILCFLLSNYQEVLRKIFGKKNKRPFPYHYQQTWSHLNTITRSKTTSKKQKSFQTAVVYKLAIFKLKVKVKDYNILRFQPISSRDNTH